MIRTLFVDSVLCAFATLRATFRFRALVVIFFLATCRTAAAAERPAAGAKPGAATPPAAAKPGPKSAAFARVFRQWQALLVDMANLKVRYGQAEARERADIEAQWKALVEKAPAKIDQLIEAAKDAFAEAPNADRQVTKLLVGMVADWKQQDDYEKAFALGKFLLDRDCKHPELPGLAGIAAFATANFAAAETWLRRARAGGKLDALAKADLASINYYKAAWPKESNLRQAEAKAHDLPRVLLVTNRGKIELELFENQAPNTTANFISLVEKGFYKGLTFHYVLPASMALGGCPNGDGSGDPGYHIKFEGDRADHRLHFRGSLSMAHGTDRDTGGSQFFLIFMPNASLDGEYTVFGRVVRGLDVLAKLTRIDPSKPAGIVPDRIIEAKVLHKRPHEYKVQKAG